MPSIALPTSFTGNADVARAAEELASRLPETLRELAAVAYNYQWSWLAGGEAVFAAIDADRFERLDGNPVRLLRETPEPVLARAAADAEFVSRVRSLVGGVEAALQARSRASTELPGPVAFMCAEFGIHRSLPLY